MVLLREEVTQLQNKSFLIYSSVSVMLLRMANFVKVLDSITVSLLIKPSMLVRGKVVKILRTTDVVCMVVYVKVVLNVPYVVISSTSHIRMVVVNLATVVYGVEQIVVSYVDTLDVAVVSKMNEVN